MSVSNLIDDTDPPHGNSQTKRVLRPKPGAMPWTLRRFLEWGYYAAIALAIIPFGSSFPLPLALSVMSFGTLTILSIGLPVVGIRLQRFMLKLTALVVILVGWCLCQTVPYANNSLAHPIWRDALGLLGPIDATISVNPGATLTALLSLSATCLAVFSGLRIFSNDAAALGLLRYLSRFGALLIGLTAAQHLILPGTLLIYEKWIYNNDFTVTFPYRNMAGTFIGTVLILNIGLAMMIANDVRLDRLFKRLRGFDLSVKGAEATLIGQILICFLLFVSLFLTRSRGAAISTVLALLVMAWTSGLAHSIARLWQSRIAKLAALAAIAIALGAAVWVFGGLTLDRVADEGIEETGRLCVYISFIGAIQDHWLVGTGFGTFADTFPTYRDPACTGIIGVWDRGFNSYLELILGVGIMGVFVIFFLLWILSMALLTGLRARRRLRFAPVASISILILVAAHSLIDYPLQIPGFAIFVGACLSAGVVISFGRDGTSSISN